MQSTLTFEEVEELILERLPGILERNPRFVTFIEGIVAEKFPRRDEFARLLEEVQQHRKETTTQFAQVEQQIQEHRDETAEQFRQVDQRFAQVEQQIQEHRNETAEQFRQVDQRFAQVEQQIQEHRNETTEQFRQVDQRFEQVDQRFEQVDQRFATLTQRMEEGFRELQSSIDRLGQRWGIRNEILFRQTMREVLEKSFGARVEERVISGEQFDCVIIDGTHILIEISASVGKDILRKLQRKRQLYTDKMGVAPARFLLVVGSIHSQRANALREAGFEVIEPETDE
jgi:hypothetical protein